MRNEEEQLNEDDLKELAEYDEALNMMNLELELERELKGDIDPLQKRY